ncbi:MAG: hypothetical protein ABSF21_00985 [Dehalococcoidia bacterium]
MKGIMFKPDMIQAIIEGRKTQTRRVIKPQPKTDLIKHANSPYWISGLTDDSYERVHIPRYQVGETVYIKEKIQQDGELAVYASDRQPVMFYRSLNRLHWRWQKPYLSSRALPEEAARYFIVITDVRAERLQEITLADVIKEGFGDATIDEFNKEFLKLNPQIGEVNPWVFVYTFRIR